jgi:hypothetical protein
MFVHNLEIVLATILVPAIPVALYFGIKKLNAFEPYERFFLITVGTFIGWFILIHIMGQLDPIFNADQRHNIHLHSEPTSQVP